MIFNWSQEKNATLKQQRNISFEEIVNAVKNSKLLDIVENPSSNFEKQKCFVIDMYGYAWLVPYAENEKEIFLKTAFPSRKYQKIYFKN